jgi:hypothetical protein
LNQAIQIENAEDVEAMHRMHAAYIITHATRASLPPGTSGLYAWVTVNYLRGQLGNDPHHTSGVLDLGGGSTQVRTYIHVDGSWDAWKDGAIMASFAKHRVTSRVTNGHFGVVNANQIYCIPFFVFVFAPDDCFCGLCQHSGRIVATRVPILTTSHML